MSFASHRFVVVQLALLCIILATAQCQPLSFCANFVPHGTNDTYDLSWWYNRDPFSLTDDRKQWNWRLALCGPLPGSCKSVNANAKAPCDWPGTAGMCQTWYSGGYNRQFCNMAATEVPQADVYQFGTDHGIVLNMFPQAQFFMYCSPSKEPLFRPVVNQNVRNGLFFSFPVVTVEHCSACAKSHPNWCGPAAPILSAQLYAGLSGAQSLMMVYPLQGELTASNPSNNTFHISGAFQNTASTSISFDISVKSEGNFHAVATLTFPAPDTIMLTMMIDGNSQPFDCLTPKSKFDHVGLSCNLPTGHTFSVEGYMLSLSS